MDTGMNHAWLTPSTIASLRPMSAPAGKRIAVLAPHPDDEVLGCGGTLAVAGMGDPGTSVTVLYLTNGEKGTSTGDRCGEELACVRREEARRGLAALGVGRAEYAGFPDGELAAGSREVACVTQFLAAHAPDIVMVPPPLDPHSDHRAAAGILAQVLAALPVTRASVWIYEVQPCFPMNALVCIDAADAAKASALAAHRSQNAERLVRAARGLAACRAMNSSHDWQFAEAFRVGSASNYVDLCGSLGLC